MAVDVTGLTNMRTEAGLRQIRYTSDLAEYAQDARVPGSYTQGVLAVPEKLDLMKSAAAAGDMARAKAYYDDVVGFFAEHSAEAARGASLRTQTADGRGDDPFLAAIRKGSDIGLARGFDTVKIQTSRGEMLSGELFGPDAKYKELARTDLRQSAGFSEEVGAGLAGGGDMAQVLGTITARPFDSMMRTGLRLSNASQYADLAHYVATHPDDLKDLGVAAVNTLVGHVLDNHMSDGTAKVFYEDSIKQLREWRKAAVSSDVAWDGAARAGTVVRANSNLTRSIAGGPGGTVSDASARGVEAIVSMLVSQDPAVDLDDARLKTGIEEVAEIFAQGYRAQVHFLPLLDNAGAPLRKAVYDYVTARSRGAEPPEDNFIKNLRDGHDMLRKILAPDWEPDPVKSKGDVREKAGLVSGLFGRSSGFADLDAAAVEVYRVAAPAFARELMRKNDDGSARTAMDALRAAFADKDMRLKMARSLASKMAVPLNAAQGLVDELCGTAFTEDGVLNPRGLDQVVSGLAFGFKADPGLSALQRPLRHWYARSVGPTAASYDRMLGPEFDRILSDEVLGAGEDYKDAASRRAYVDAVRQRVKKEMHDAALKGEDPETIAILRKNYGNYYYVSGYLDPAGRYHAGTPSPDAVRKGAVPQISRSSGPLKDVEQPVDGWVIPGSNAMVPKIEKGLWQTDPHRFALYMRMLRDFARRQAAEAAKVSAKPPEEGDDGLRRPHG